MRTASVIGAPKSDRKHGRSSVSVSPSSETDESEFHDSSSSGSSSSSASGSGSGSTGNRWSIGSGLSWGIGLVAKGLGYTYGNKIENICGYKAIVYNAHGVRFVIKKRSEHLSESEVKNIQSRRNLFQGGDTSKLEAFSKELEAEEKDIKERAEEAEAEAERLEVKQKPHRASLPPYKATITEDEYFSFREPHLHLGRPTREEVEEKTYTAQVAMVEDFPLTVEEFTALLDIAAPHNRMVLKLKEFVEKSLPEGFPVRLIMSVFPTVTATVTCTEFKSVEVDDDKFAIPTDYVQRERKRKRRRRRRPSNVNTTK